MLYLDLGRWSWGCNRPQRYWTDNSKVWGCGRYKAANIENVNFHQVICFFMLNSTEGKNEKFSLGHFQCMIITQVRMSTRWRQLLILSTNRLESASFVPKKGLNSGTRIEHFSYCELNCEDQFHHVSSFLVLSWPYILTDKQTFYFGRSICGAFIFFTVFQLNKENSKSYMRCFYSREKKLNKSSLFSSMLFVFFSR